MNLLKRRFSKLWFLLRTRGVVYTYNYFWVYGLYYNENFREYVAKYLPWLYFPTPRTIEIEVTTRCGLRCRMCEHTYWSEAGRDISFDTFKRLIDQLPKLKWIGLTGIGDSFIHKDFLKMLAYVKKRNIYVELFDTFFNINEEAANALVDLQIDKMIASIDGATQETYEKIRVGSNFERITGNIKRLVALRKAKGRHFPEMAFHFIVSKLNVHEMVQYVDFVNELMQGETVEIFFTKLLHPFKEIEDLVVDVDDEMIKNVEAKGRELGQIIRWNMNVPKDKPAINHCSAWLVPFVFASGDVIPCCAGNEANHRDFQVKTSLGNIFKQSFRDIWNSDNYRKFRRQIFNNEIPEACRFCTIYNVKKT